MKKLWLVPLVVVPAVAGAQEIVSIKELKPKMDAAVVKALAQKGMPDGKANTLGFRILSLTINGQRPALENYYVGSSLTGVAACNGDREFSSAKSYTDRSEVTLTETEGGSVTLDVSVGGSMGPVEGSVAAGVEAHYEKGTSTTRGNEVTMSTGQTWTIPKGTGEWIGPQGWRYNFTNAEYVAEVEVTKAMYSNLVTTGTPSWQEKQFGEGKPNKPLKFKIKGHFSAHIIDGALEIGSVPMTADEFKAACPTGGGRPNTSVAGAAAGRTTGMGGESQQLSKAVTPGAKPPASFKAHKKG